MVVFSITNNSNGRKQRWPAHRTSEASKVGTKERSVIRALATHKAIEEPARVMTTEVTGTVRNSRQAGARRLDSNASVSTGAVTMIRIVGSTGS